jgi:hypothetical protein
MTRIFFGPVNIYLAIFFRVYYYFGILTTDFIGVITIIFRLIIVKQVCSSCSDKLKMLLIWLTGN